MFENKYGKLLTGLLIAGIVVIVAVLIFLGVQLIQSNTVQTGAEDAFDDFQTMLNAQKENVMTNEQNTELTAPIIGVNDMVVSGGNTTNDNEMEYEGFPMVGTIEIPVTDLKSPILKEASRDSIKVAIAVYNDSGPGLNQVGNTVLVGHNYRNGTFFSDNKKLVEGDKIYITDATGNRVEYTIYNTYITSPEDSSYIDRDTGGRREISLTTCTDDTNSRLVIWATAD